VLGLCLSRAVRHPADEGSTKSAIPHLPLFLISPEVWAKGWAGTLDCPPEAGHQRIIGLRTLALAGFAVTESSKIIAGGVTATKRPSFFSAVRRSSAVSMEVSWVSVMGSLGSSGAGRDAKPRPRLIQPETMDPATSVGPASDRDRATSLQQLRQNCRWPSFRPSVSQANARILFPAQQNKVGETIRWPAGLSSSASGASVP
jgi:hypothetical protein